MKIRKRKDYNGKKPWVCEYKDISGKKRRTHFISKMEAEKFGIAVEGEAQRLTHHLPEHYKRANKMDVTLQELYDIYVEKRMDVVSRGRPRARKAENDCLIPFVQKFGQVKASQLKPIHLEDFKKERMSNGIEELTYQNQVVRFKSMLRWGKRNDLMILNPANDYQVGKKAKPKKKRWALTDDQVRSFIIGLRENNRELKEWFIVGVNTGLRIMEMWTLTWDDVDLQSNPPTITIREKTITEDTRERKRGKFTPIVFYPKNEFSERTIPISPSVVDVFNDIGLRGRPYRPFVLWHPDVRTVSQYIKWLSKQILGEKFQHTAHIWRHTFATREIFGPKVELKDGRVRRLRGDVGTVAALGGWSPNAKVLMEIYHHVEVMEQGYESVCDLDIGERHVSYPRETAEYPEITVPVDEKEAQNDADSLTLLDTQGILVPEDVTPSKKRKN